MKIKINSKGRRWSIEKKSSINLVNHLPHIYMPRPTTFEIIATLALVIIALIIIQFKIETNVTEKTAQLEQLKSNMANAHAFNTRKYKKLTRNIPPQEIYGLIQKEDQIFKKPLKVIYDRLAQLHNNQHHGLWVNQVEMSSMSKSLKIQGQSQIASTIYHFLHQLKQGQAYQALNFKQVDVRSSIDIKRRKSAAELRKKLIKTGDYGFAAQDWVWQDPSTWQPYRKTLYRIKKGAIEQDKAKYLKATGQTKKSSFIGDSEKSMALYNFVISTKKPDKKFDKWGGKR